MTRVLRNADPNPDTGCLVSRYAPGNHGYAQAGWVDSGRSHGTTAHRIAWAAAHGQIPDGMTVDHTCRNRRCIALPHLRLLPNLQNARRTSGRDWPIGVCIRGHSDEHWEPKSERYAKGACRICKKENSLAFSERRRRGEVRHGQRGRGYPSPS